jgi:hypothetical protein
VDGTMSAMEYAKKTMAAKAKMGAINSAISCRRKSNAMGSIAKNTATISGSIAMVKRPKNP